MSFKKTLKKLPTYVKEWTKEKSTSGYSESAKQIYLVIEKDTSLKYKKETLVYRIAQPESNGKLINGIWFFELFKYLKKYEHTKTYLSLADRVAIKKSIKNHLLVKHSQQLEKDKLNLLFDYSQLINYCFDQILKEQEAKITLVIQKKLGYKYYENIVYT
jgi:hypothetical protein